MLAHWTHWSASRRHTELANYWQSPRVQGVSGSVPCLPVFQDEPRALLGGRHKVHASQVRQRLAPLRQVLHHCGPHRPQGLGFLQRTPARLLHPHAFLPRSPVRLLPRGLPELPAARFQQSLHRTQPAGSRTLGPVRGLPARSDGASSRLATGPRLGECQPRVKAGSSLSFKTYSKTPERQWCL